MKRWMGWAKGSEMSGGWGVSEMTEFVRGGVGGPWECVSGWAREAREMLSMLYDLSVDVHRGHMWYIAYLAG